MVQDEPSSCPGADGSAHCSSSDRARRQRSGRRRTKLLLLLLLLLTCGVEGAAAGLSAPISVCLDQLDEEACVRRVQLLICPRLLPAPVFSLSVLFDKKVSRGLLREAGEEVRVHGHQLPGNSFVQGAHVGKLQHPSPSPAARKAGSLSRLNRSCFPLVAMLQNRLVTRTKTSQTRDFCVVTLYLPLYQAVTFPKMIDGISLRFRFDRPFERPFRNQFSELAPRPQHSVQKIPSNGMQTSPVSDVDRRTNTIHVRSEFSFARCALARPNEVKRRLSRSNGERFPPCFGR